MGICSMGGYRRGGEFPDFPPATPTGDERIGMGMVDEGMGGMEIMESGQRLKRYAVISRGEFS